MKFLDDRPAGDQGLGGGAGSRGEGEGARPVRVPAEVRDEVRRSRAELRVPRGVPDALSTFTLPWQGESRELDATVPTCAGTCALPPESLPSWASRGGPAARVRTLPPGPMRPPSNLIAATPSRGTVREMSHKGPKSVAKLPSIARPAEAIGALAGAVVARAASATGVEARGAQSIGALAIGATAIGAAAIGGFAIGRLSVKRLKVGRATFERMEIEELEIDDLTIGKLTVREGLPDELKP